MPELVRVHCVLSGSTGQRLPTRRQTERHIMASRTPLPTVTEVASNLRTHRALASTEAIVDGTAWYPGCAAIMDAIATEAFDRTGDVMDIGLVAGIVAAFSQNATWKANLTMARNYCNGTGQNGMARVMAEIDAMEDGANPRDILGLKRSDFWSNMTGDLQPVTCDRWHLRAAFGDRKVALTPEVHALVTEATRIVAAEYGEAPATCQAVIWCHIRGTGA